MSSNSFSHQAMQREQDFILVSSHSDISDTFQAAEQSWHRTQAVSVPTFKS